MMNFGTAVMNVCDEFRSVSCCQVQKKRESHERDRQDRQRERLGETD